MKKRNLFLSLICSIILTVALATFTIISVVNPGKDKNAGNNQQAGNVSDSTNVGDQTPAKDINADRDGSKDAPYLLYDADSFIKFVTDYGYTKIEAVKEPEMTDKLDDQGQVVVDEEGKPVQVPVLDGEGNVVMKDKVDEEGNVIYNDSTYFELANDIDFAGKAYTTLFNQDKPFNGHINGKDFALKNITIDVNKENLGSFVYKNEANKNRYDANIAIFGRVEKAEIVGLKVDNVSVSVADEVYAYIADGGFFNDYEGNAVNDIKVATFAAVSKNSVLDVDVTGSIKAAAYTLVLGKDPQANSAIGGLVGLAVSTEIKDSNIDVTFTSSETALYESYFVGGFAGQAYYSTVATSSAKLAVATSYEYPINIGGAFGYMVDTDIENTKINLAVTESKTRGNFRAVSDYGFDYTRATWVAGIAPMIKAGEDESVNITNVTIVATADIDAVYAGAVVEIAAGSVESNIAFKNVIIDSTVNTLEAFGFARYLGEATVSYDEDATATDANNNIFNVRLVGKVILRNEQDQGNGSKDPAVAKGNIATSAFNKDFIFAGKAADFKIVISEEIFNKLLFLENKTVGRLEFVTIV